MSVNKNWRIFCLTESTWSYGTLSGTDGNPTECFNDPNHSINENSIQLLSEESLIESTDPNSGALVTKGGLGVVKNINIGGLNSGNPNDIFQIKTESLNITDSETPNSGTQPLVVFNKFSSSTLNAVNSNVTIENAATIYIEGSPIQGTNQTIINSFGLLVDGNVKINGILKVDNINASSVEIKEAYIRDEKPIGTNGGSFYDNSWRTRDLNTITCDTNCGISLNNNQITLQSGTYTIWGKAPAYKVEQHKARLRNITDDTTEIVASTEYAKEHAITSSVLYSKITLTSEKVFELQHRCDKDKSGDGFGQASGFDTEVYSMLIIKKIL